ncbi:MAG: hypothetical protein Q6364_12800 [Candidatus Hermodarchaeota archaeon]|nr:hypothetical protein [Candidatus Hermodarchaeota archaeon]
MTRKWSRIAKAEYQVSTVSFRENRTRNITILYALGLIWALFLAPYIIGIMADFIIPIEILQIILINMLPGFMRAAMFFIWILILIIPLSRSLQEIKIGQWEIFLSNNVSTRDILIGTFIGRIPLYGLLVLFITPPFLVLFFLAFEVALLGQILTYLTLFLMILTTIWLANLITAAIQAKLGESSRGKDIANGVAILLAIVSIVPIYGIMFFSQHFSVILGLNVFLLFPFTWPADVISWITIHSSQIGFSVEQILAFQQILNFDLLFSTALMSIFTIAVVGIGLASADRIFTYNIGARTEQVTTITREHFVIRGIRKLAPGSFGSLVVTCFKDFFRRASNISKIAYGIILAVVLPFIMSQIMINIGDVGGFDMMALIMVGGIGMAMIGGYTFSGTAFMESKDQLWIIQSTPSGTARYVKARLVSAFIIAIPLGFIPALVMTLLSGGTLDRFLFLVAYGYVIIAGAIMFGTGVTAWNPYYEDTKSPEHQMNVIITTMGAQFTLFAPILITMFGDMAGLPFWNMIHDAVGATGMPYAFALISMISLLIVGSLALVIGVKRLSRPEI